MNKRIWIFLAVALPASVYGQCMQIVGTNQIVCPNYANSTPPVWQGPSIHLPIHNKLA